MRQEPSDPANETHLAIAKAIAYLEQHQLPDGSFTTEASPTSEPFTAQTANVTVFTPALMLEALSQVPGAMAVRQKLADWLLAQKSAQGSFNYWAKNASEREIRPYPDDLDDTFCALAGLYRHDLSLIGPDTLAEAVRVLLCAESQVGGPYYTWLAPPNAPKVWRDIDLAVNANVAYFLRLAAQIPPNLVAFLEQAITAGTFLSPYYPNAYPLVYYVARAYRGPREKHLADWLRKQHNKQHPDQPWSTPLQTALAVTSLYRLEDDYQPDLTINYLLKTQQPDGSWPAEPFWRDAAPETSDEPWFAGSSALTTAFSIEALQNHTARTAVSHAPAPQVASRAGRSHNSKRSVISKAKNMLGGLEPTLRRTGQDWLDTVVAHDANDEITLLAYSTAKDLLKTSHQSDDIFILLGAANLLGWSAYTIYDSFLDTTGNPRLLPLANAALRGSLKAFHEALPKHAAFQKLVAETFDVIDSANAWEVTHCRFDVRGQEVIIGRLPSYGRLNRLAERSLGHALGPLGVLAASGITPTGRPAAKLFSGLKHYLIARQLHDDLHDWEEDLQTGQCTYVVAELLRQSATPAGSYQLPELLPQLRRFFWHDALPGICETLLRHLALARQHIVHSALLQANNSLSRLLDGLQTSTGQTLTERMRTLNFIAAYENSTATNPTKQ